MYDIIKHYESSAWLATDDIHRNFVVHPDLGRPSGKIRIISHHTDILQLSVIIPTVDANRNGCFLNLLKDIENQRMTAFELLVLKGDSRQGRAINICTAVARGRFLMTLDDDTMLPDPDTFTKLIAVMNANPDIGIAGGNNVIPPAATPFVRHIMDQIPRRSWQPVKEIIDSDLAEHPCMIMRTDEFKAVGGENELLPRGLDPYLRQQFRKIGKRVVIVPGVIYHHLPPDTLPGLLKQFFRNGTQAAYTNKHYPQWVIETPADHGSFQSTVPFKFRLIRFPLRILKALFTGKPLWMLSEIAYGFGYLYQMAKGDNENSEGN